MSHTWLPYTDVKSARKPALCICMVMTPLARREGRKEPTHKMLAVLSPGCITLDAWVVASLLKTQHDSKPKEQVC